MGKDRKDGLLWEGLLPSVPRHTRAAPVFELGCEGWGRIGRMGCYGRGCCVDVGRGLCVIPAEAGGTPMQRGGRYVIPAHGCCAQPPSFRRKPESRGAGQRSAKRNAKSKPPLIPPWASRGRVVHSTRTRVSIAKQSTPTTHPSRPSSKQPPQLLIY